jgi:lipoprotein NlpD
VGPGTTDESLVSEPKALKLPYSEQNLALLGRPKPPAVQEPKTLAEPPAARTEPAPKSEEQAKPEGADAVDWGWPATGKIIARFSDPSNKGLDIAGRAGDAVLAAASGVVLYVGTGIPSLGKLVIIKHNSNFLSAYAHNENVLVKLDQRVVKGQKIAEIGSTGTDQTKLHFEIRQLGKPVDPLKYLPERPS